MERLRELLYGLFVRIIRAAVAAFLADEIAEPRAAVLMMRQAFETWGCVRVELKTNVLNRRSRDAMLRIGCVEEGVLRKHAISDAGVRRDTVYYSVLDDEWPAVKAKIEAMMDRA